MEQCIKKILETTTQQIVNKIVLWMGLKRDKITLDELTCPLKSINPSDITSFVTLA